MEEMQAMAGAVSALVSRAGGESKLERDAGFTCAKLCDPVTRRRGASRDRAATYAGEEWCHRPTFGSATWA